MIEDVRLDRVRLPLKVPYKLALGAVTAFDTILARIVIGGSVGYGEATILTGYTSETIEDAWRRAQALAQKLVRLSPEAARALAHRDLADAPFTLTAFITAIEMAERHPLLAIDADQGRATARRHQCDQLRRHRARNRGRDRMPATARSRSRPVSMSTPISSASPSFSAATPAASNCASTPTRATLPPTACALHPRSSPNSIELLEQPCHADDWDAAAAIAKASTVPFMLDESIYGLEDIKRAAALGARFVKLKLMKMVSLTALAEGLTLIRDLGMEPVLGNGVASDLGCWMEACVARRYITNAGEMNGFLRQQSSLAAAPIAVERGEMQLRAGHPLVLDDIRIAATRIAHAHVRRPQHTHINGDG